MHRSLHFLSYASCTMAGSIEAHQSRSMRNLLDYNVPNLSWKSLSIQGRLGIICLNISLLGPFYMALTLIGQQNNDFFAVPPLSEAPWRMYFSLIGPIQLLMSAVLMEVWTNFFIVRGNKIAWWAALAGTMWIGLNDSMASLIFWIKFPDLSTPPLAPFVTTGLLLGLYLIKSSVFNSQSATDQA